MIYFTMEQRNGRLNIEYPNPSFRLDPANRDARDGLNRIDLVGSRPGVHHDAAGGSYDQMDLALEEEEINDVR